MRICQWLGQQFSNWFTKTKIVMVFFLQKSNKKLNPSRSKASLQKSSDCNLFNSVNCVKCSEKKGQRLLNSPFDQKQIYQKKNNYNFFFIIFFLLVFAIF